MSEEFADENPPDTTVDHLSRIGDGYLSIGPDWTITAASQPAANLVNRRADALVGVDLWTAFPDGVDTRFQREYESVLETGDPTTFQAYYDPLDTWFEVNAYPDDDGLAIYFRDVTERVKRARMSRRLNDATGRLHGTETVDETWSETVDIVETALDLPLVSCRQRIDDRLVPMAVSEVAERYDLEPVGPDHPLWESFASGEHSVIELDEGYEGVDSVLLFPLGDHGLLGVGDFETGTYPEHLIEGGQTLADHLTTALDRAVREERLREREHSLERYETIVQAAGDAIYWLDDDGCFQRVNDRMVAMTGYDRDRLVGADASLLLPDRDVAACETEIRSLVSGETSPPVTVSVELHTADGATRYCELSIAPLFVGDHLDGTVGVIRDRTGLKHREQRLVVMDRVLRHNLRNKMNLVLGELSALDENEHVDVIRSVATDLLALSDNARQFEDVIDPDGKTDVAVDVVDAAERVVDDFSRGFPDATLRLDAPESAVVSANPAIEMAVSELVENAITHAETAPTVTVAVTHEDDAVLIEVDDDGPGIGSNELEALEAKTERPLAHTSGLGLWLVSWTVESSGGELTFDVRDGTAVRIRLPTAESS